MTARVIPFPPRPEYHYHAHCDECDLKYYHWRVDNVRRWAKSHARAYHHHTRTPDGLAFGVVNSQGVEYGTD